MNPNTPNSIGTYRLRAESDADIFMTQRLSAINSGHIEITDTDKRFYAHSLRIIERLRILGVSSNYISKRNPSLWINVHTAALEDLKLSNDETLRYTSEAIEAAHKQELRAFEYVCESKCSAEKLEQAIQSENLRDLLSVLALGLIFPCIDTLFGRYRFEVIASGELCETYVQLFEEGVLAEGSTAIAIPGPTWKSPDFMIKKRYIQ